MTTRKLPYAAILTILLGIGGTASSMPLAGSGVDGSITTLGIEAEPLIAIEASRTGIVRRIVADYTAELTARQLDVDALRYALVTLRADQLLAAALVESLDEVIAIAAQPVATGPALQRYVAITPLTARDSARLPAAGAYLVRDGESLQVQAAASFAFRNDRMQVVGYFMPTTASLQTGSGVARESIALKDSAGSGSGSWLGRTTGGNLATGLDSAVAAGSYNQATAQGAFVGAGTANAATGISSLVIGGFDNRATAIDALVGAGAGNRASGARSIVVGGGYNVASGGFSFVGGGGRNGVT